MAARTGKQYLAGLADSREIWFEGKRVDSVVAHPVLGRMAHTLAEIYDLQHDPALKTKLTYLSPTTGNPVRPAISVFDSGCPQMANNCPSVNVPGAGAST